jgi:hypothetical protein
MAMRENLADYDGQLREATPTNVEMDLHPCEMTVRPATQREGGGS